MQQPPVAGEPGGRLSVHVEDTSGGVLPGATVTLAGPLPGTAVKETVTDTAGVAQIAQLPPGRYSLRVALPGFETASVSDLAIEAGATVEQEITLGLETYTAQVTVTPDSTQRRLADNFTETLSAEEIDQLPDDPDAAAALIAELAGPGAEIRVNGFEEGDLPPKSQIQAIRIRQDPFAPDARGAGRPRVEIITKPGMSGWEHTVRLGLNDQSIDARNAFADERGKGQTRRLRWSSSGPLVKGRTSLAFTIAARNGFDLEPIVAVVPGSPPPDEISQQRRRVNADVRIEHALTPAQTLRVSYQHRDDDRNNLGVGEFSLPERAYDLAGTVNRFRVSHIATFGTKTFNELRFEHSTRSDGRRSRSDNVTVDVANAFIAGGAQLGGGTRSYEIELRDDLDLALNDRHKLRFGFEGEYGRIRSDETANTRGRFIFPGLDAYLAGRPIQFEQRVGEPSIAFSRYEVSWYAYDELRPREDLQLGLGVRHDFQSFTHDWANFGPRASVAWTPAAVEDTTFRAGFGIFTGSYDSDLHGQTLLLDGTHQRDLIVSDPGWPEPFENAAGVEMPPPSIIREGVDLELPTTRRISVGVERELGDAVEVQLNGFDESTWNRLRSLDVNTPVDGRRPNPDFARITEIRSVGHARERGASLSVRVRAGELFGTARYRWSRELDDADGALSLPADSTNPAAEWGPASDDVRHDLFGYMRLRLSNGVAFGLSARASSGEPYTVRTGFDDNGDQVPNDRPPGVGRNSKRGEWQSRVDLRVGWTFWRHAADSNGGTATQGRDGQPRGRGGQSGRRFDRGTEIYAEIENLFNTVNFTRYSGVLTSRYFGQPTAADVGRRTQFGLRVFF